MAFGYERAIGVGSYELLIRLSGFLRVLTLLVGPGEVVEHAVGGGIIWRRGEQARESIGGGFVLTQTEGGEAGQLQRFGSIWFAGEHGFCVGERAGVVAAFQPHAGTEERGVVRDFGPRGALEALA
jgi:hypothetical protein